MSTVCMVDATFKYTYEYQGKAPKLVYTPLAEKCYLTLTQGKHKHTVTQLCSLYCCNIAVNMMAGAVIVLK